MRPHPTSQNTNDTLRAGTGFMLQPIEAIEDLQKDGYDQNLVARFDHFELRSGADKAYPNEFEVDEVVRFENTSDPSDQSILYAISSPSHGWKGIYLESYGLYHDDLSTEMIEKLGRHRH